MNPSSLVSILIPAYNAAAWIGETLQSALSQTHVPCEIIVVDDGSTDGTVDVCRQFQAEGVRLFRQKNAGAAAARNHCLRHATGNYIQFLDADDLLDPDKIAIQLRELHRRPAGSIAAGPWGRFEQDPSTAVFTPEDNWADMSPHQWLQLNFAGRGMMPPAAWLAPRRLISKAGPWDETLTLNDDGEYYCRVLLQSAGVVFCAQARSYYRSGLKGSLSRSADRLAWDSAWRSQLSCANALINSADTEANHQACSELFMRLAHSVYPEYLDIAQAAVAESQRHGRPTIRLGGGPIVRWVDRLAGWRAARRIQRWGQHRRKGQ